MTERYHAEMLISDVLNSNRAAAGVFVRHGLGCPSCLAAEMETLAAVAQIHEVDVDQLIGELDALEDESTEEVR